MTARRMLIGTVLGCLFLLSPGLAVAEDDTASQARFGFFTASADGAVETFDLSEVLALAERVCNGGSCLTKDGKTLNCPTSGGPTCGEGQICTCRCSGDPLAYNDCIDKPKPGGDPNPDPNPTSSQE
jgi:hypothetical protein